MTHRLFIDDERFPATGDEDMVVVRSSREAIDHVSAHGMPDFISFDHDLGGDDTSVVFLNWLQERVLDGDLTFPEGFSYFVHSANPIGAANLRGRMDPLLDHARSMARRDGA